jgi:nitrate reductase cytochrome c-type subunit
MMKSKVLFASLACLVIASSAVAASCASTKTLTVTQIQTRTQNQTATVATTIVRTITQTIGGETQTTEVTLTGQPPLIPHPIDVVNGLYGTCFQCHPIPVGHQGRLANESVCTQCHLLGPIDPNLFSTF